jgi:hypothetical protein
VPAPSQILETLSALAQEWWVLAVIWHLYFAALAALLALKWQLIKPLAAFILAVPLLSVVAMAWLSGNPFTTSVLGAVFIGLTAIGWRLPRTTLSIAVGPLLVPGLLMVIFGLVYPHFLGAASFLTYLYAAPVGIVPCPTLSVLVGFSIILGSMGSRSWGVLLGAAGIFYGAFGALRLGVALDWVLFAGAVVLLFSVWNQTSKSAATGTAA